MKDEQYKRAAELFHEAVELAEDVRRTYLDRTCGQDPELREYVEQLLAEDLAEEDAFEESRLHLRQELLADALGVDTKDRERGEGRSSPTELLPETIGSYRILEKLGEGGMGSVYLAEQDHPKRRVALKMIRPGMFSASLRKRFKFEAEVLGRLQHPGIAQIHEAGELPSAVGPQPYFAMEYIQGIGLTAYVEKQALPVRARLELVARIADAAHHAHQKGIVHRDLKPENVLVMEEATATVGSVDAEFADLGQPKILDFGVARATDADVQLTTMCTGVDQLVGTLPYMSPEQVAGDSRQLDARSDIYALGVLLYEVLAGRPPFDVRHKPIPEAVRIIREEEPTRLGSIDSAFRGDIDTIACKALEKDSDRRFSSAAHLASDLRRYLANEPINAHPPSTFYQLRKLAQRNKGLVIGLALTLLVLIVGILSSLTFALRALQGEELAEKNEARAVSGEAAAERNAHRLNLVAAQAVGERDSLRALDHLEAVPPELRDWEWRHLYSCFNSHVAEYRGDSFSGVSPTIARRPGGGLLAALQRGETIELVDLSSGEIRSVFSAPEGLSGPSLALEGTHLSALSGDQKKAYVWNTETGDLLSETPLDDDEIRGSLLSPHGKWLVVRSGAGPATIIETATGRREPIPRLTRTHFGGGAFDSDGSRLFTEADSGNAVIYSMEERRITASRSFRDDEVSFAFSQDGQRVAIGQLQRMIRILDPSTLEEIIVLRGHTQTVVTVAFSIDGGYLASAAHDGTIRVWDLARGETVRVFPWIPRAGQVTSLAFSSDGKLLAAGNSSAARLWKWRDDARSVLEGHESYVYRVAVHPDGSLIASGPFQGDVRLWDALTGEPVAALDAHNSRFFFGFTPDGARLLVSNGASRTTAELAVWDPFAACRLDQPRSAGDSILFEATEPTAVGSELRFFRAAAGGSKAVDNCGEVIASSVDRASLIRTSQDALALSLWDLGTGELIREIGTHEARILATAISPDGTRLLSGDMEGVIKVWDLAGGLERATLRGHSSDIFTISFHPDGTRFASSGNDANIIVWDAETLEQVLVLRGHTSYVHSLVFSPDGTRLVSGSGDRTVRIWDSIPPTERWRQIREAEALQLEAEPLVDRLLAELGHPLDVADSLRRDQVLNEGVRRAALRVLLKRSGAGFQNR